MCLNRERDQKYVDVTRTRLSLFAKHERTNSEENGPEKDEVMKYTFSLV